MLLWQWGLQVLLASVEVSGNASCPSPADVAVKLSRPSSGPSSAAHAFVDQTPAGVHVALKNSDGQLLGEGTLSDAESCEDLASAAAVMIEAWQARLSSPAPVPTLPIPRPLAPAGDRPEGEVASQPLRVGLSAAPVMFIGWGPSAFGFRITGSLGPGEARWQAELGVTAQGLREVSLGPGAADWRRSSLQLGPVWTVLDSPLHVDVGFFGAASLLQLQGRHFETNLSTRSFEIGAGASAKVSYPAPLHPFATWITSFWPGEQKLAAAGVDEAATVPTWEGCLAVGLEWNSP